MKISLEEQFRYHPPTTSERIEKHNVLNNAALEFARVILQVTDADQHQKLIDKIQVVRMLANQAITYSEIIKNSGD